MLRTFNCGIGMIVVASPEKTDAVVKAFTRAGETVVMLGNIISASGDTSVAYDGKLNLG
jgi:phosphoribosylformylglycinamidine cyclo-ligase